MNRHGRIRHIAAIGAALLVLIPSLSESLGIAMKFVDITLEKVSPGASFNLRVIRNLPLVVINMDDQEETDIVVESVLPREDEMKDGYEVIPDPTWVRVVPNRFRLGPKASASADVIVTIPEDKSLIGKHYEVILWARTDKRRGVQGRTGVIIQAGLRSRLRMSIGIMGPESLQQEKAMKRLAEINTNFNISPDNLFANNVQVGKPVDLKLEHKAALRVINEADDPVKLRLTPIVPDENIIPQSGYVYAPDPKWLTLKPEVVTTPGTAIKEVRLTVNIPDKPEHRNKKYMFLVRTTLADESLPLAYNNMVYVATAP